ncbi:MAG: tripartite tricarboxylate transporter substrate binding protein [Burkholderiaceae bacterium]
MKTSLPTRLIASPTRRRLSLGAAALAAGGTLGLPRAAGAADPWPARPVEFVVPFPPGGPVDVSARTVTQAVSALWQQPAVVDNKAGAGGIVGAQLAAKQPADGYHFFFPAIHHAILPSLRGNLPYDIEKDFVPVAMITVFPIILVARPTLPVNSVAELIAYAKANPGKLTYSSSGVGGGTHLAGELFASMTGTKLLHVPYKGSAPAMADLLGGQVDLMFSDAPTATEQIRVGKVRALGISTKARSALMPEVPTIAEAGVPGYESNSWTALVAPAGTPAPIVARVNADMVKVLNDPATRDRLLKVGAEPMPGTPEDLKRFLHAEIAKWSKIIREANIKPE